MSHYGGGAEHGDKFNKKDKYGNPIQYTGGNIGGHGHKTQTAGGGEYVTKGHGAEGGGGILHRSNSSSSSSSEDDGQGGRRKKSIKEKMKEKLPGGNKPTTGQDAYAHSHGATTTIPGEGYGSGYGAATATTTHHVYGAHGGTDEQQPAKKGFMEKIRDKLPGHH